MNMSLKKLYNEKKPTCKVTFKLSKAEAGDASRVNLVGDFNNWDQEITPMKKLKDGSFTASLELKKGWHYQFRYLVDGTKWLNDPKADRYIPNIYLGDNSVVIL
jgi:1,4-alpha-glucan branching enzyme